MWRYINTDFDIVSSDNREKIKVSLMLVGDVHPSANSKKLKQWFKGTLGTDDATSKRANGGEKHSENRDTVIHVVFLLRLSLHSVLNFPSYELSANWISTNSMLCYCYLFLLFSLFIIFYNFLHHLRLLFCLLLCLLFTLWLKSLFHSEVKPLLFYY